MARRSFGEVARPVAAHGLRRADPRVPRVEVLARVLREQLDARARAGEDDRLDVLGLQLREHLGGGARHAAADAELGVHDLGVVEPDEALAAGRAVVVDEVDRAAGERGGVRGGVGDGGRAADEDGVAAVEAADALQPPQHVGDVRAEDASIAVQLVDDDVAQVLEEPHPLRMVGEDAAVQHVGVRDHDVPGDAGGAPRARGGVAVVGLRADLAARGVGERAQLLELVLRERLRREEVERARRGVREDRAQHGHRVAERLARRRRRDDDLVAAGEGARDGARLVGVRSLDAARAQRRDDARVDGRGPVCVAGQLLGGAMPGERAARSRLEQRGCRFADAHGSPPTPFGGARTYVRTPELPFWSSRRPAMREG